MEIDQKEYDKLIVESVDKQSYTVYSIDPALPPFSILKSEVIGYGIVELTRYMTKALKLARKKRDAEFAAVMADEIMTIDFKNKTAVDSKNK